MENQREMMGPIERHENLYQKKPETAEMMRPKTVQLHFDCITDEQFDIFGIQLIPRIPLVNDL